jgi:trk system potassium uptake protein
MTSVDLRPVTYVIGALLVILAVAMMAPLLVDLSARSTDWRAFAMSAALTLFFGGAMMLSSGLASVSLNLRQTFVLTSFAWIIVCLFSSLPFMLSDLRLGFADAYFEAMSGLTTTGASVIADVESVPPGILLWRSLLVWLGGIGIVGLGIVVLPFLRVGGMQLFRSESSDKSDKVVPRAADFALAFGWIYMTLTIACIIALSASGMPVFDAICHSMSALGTGGFSTRNLSVGGFGLPAAELWLTLFMFLGSLPFVRFISLMRGDGATLWRDSQIRVYSIMLLLVSGVLAITLWQQGQMGLADALRHSLFNVVSIVTTTGFASTDYTLWGSGAQMLFLVLTLIGGCTGSTSGGIKIFRFEILWIALRRQVVRSFSPNRMLPLNYNGKPVGEEVVLSVMAFTFVYLALLFITALGLGLTGLDMVSSVSGAAAALGNVGPGLGSVIGPVGNYAPLQDEAKWMMSLAMLLGRLELFTVLVLLSPKFWRS